MTPFYEKDDVVLHHGDCRDVLASMSENSVDAVVCDPPYELGFMGKAWDSAGVSFKPETWAAALRVLKPGGHLLAFGGSRTFHRIAVAIEDAGFEIRDTLSWLYGTGFPKSLDVAKAIESGGGRPEDIRRMQLGADYKPSGRGRLNYDHGAASAMGGERADWTPSTEAARRWEGWGTALKPAWEPIILARKPLAGTVASNVQTHGTGALNIDGCRINPGTPVPGGGNGVAHRGGIMGTQVEGGRARVEPHDAGRWPANVVLDEETADALDKQASGVSRFFYCAKASRPERGEGNTHPTVKPLALMRWLVRLVAPSGGLVLDPFAGSGTTLLAARAEGFHSVGVEMEEAHCAIIASRLETPLKHGQDGQRLLFGDT